MTSPAIPAQSAYREALLEARRTMFRLDATASRRIIEALREFATDLARTDPSSSAAVHRVAARLDTSLADAVSRGRRLSFRDTLAVWRSAAEDAAAAHGIAPSLLVGIRLPPVTLLAAYESGGGRAATWRTLLHGHVQNAAREADAIVRRALTSGMAPDELARRLRRYVVGSEEFRQAFPDIDPADLRNVPREALDAARRMRFNAERIAFTEVHNARAEAEVQHFAADPLVKAVRWSLSPDRGDVRTPDECDVLAATDFYGLGAGVYPVHRVPTTPHPFDRCERLPVTRPSTEADQPKPRPRRQLDPDTVPIPNGERLSPAAAARVRSRVAEALRVPAIGGRRLEPGPRVAPPPAPVPPVAAVPPRFVPTGSIADAEAFARLTGVGTADFGVQRLDIANGIGEVLDDLAQRGLPVPRVVRVSSRIAYDFVPPWEVPVVPGFYAHWAETVVFNTSAQYWRNPVDYAQRAYAVGFSSTDHRLHVIRHEFGHHAHHARHGIQPKGTQIPISVRTSAMVREVGRYGMSEQAEFVAEVFAALLDGRALSPETLRLYRELGGPIL